MCFPEASHQLQCSEGAQLQDTIGQGEQQSMNPIENAKEVDRQNGIIPSGMRAEHGGERIWLQALP